MPSSLPPELHDYAVDFLFDDKRSLFSCSLVSREWRVVCQYHLFHTIQVRHPISISCLNTFLESSPHLSSFIRELTLCGSGATNGTCFDDQMPVTAHDISTCILHLPKLRSFCVDGVWWTDTSRLEEQFVTTPHVAASLSRFSIRKVFTTPGVLLDTICIFPSIGTLDIERVYWIYGIDRSEPCTSPSRKPTLGALRVGSGSTYNMLRCFLPLVESRMDVSALSSLALEFEHFDAWQELVGFLRSVSPHLQELSLRFGRYAMSSESSEAQLRDLKLSSLSALRSFHVHLLGDDAHITHLTRSWSLLHSLIALLPPDVSNLTVVHTMHVEVLRSQLSTAVWSSIDDLLAGPAFKAIGDVTIRTELAAPGCGLGKIAGFHCFSSDDLWDYLGDNQDRTQAFFKEKLPQCEARGILSVH